jgi:hypothetical protein
MVLELVGDGVAALDQSVGDDSDSPGLRKVMVTLCTGPSGVQNR